jgi:hypothetical protein
MMRCLQKERKLDGFNCVSFLEVSSILRVCRLRFQCSLEQLAASRLSLRPRKNVSCLEKRSYMYSHRWHAHRQGCAGGASFEPRKVLPIAAHDCHRQADSTSRHIAALASRVPRVARLLGNIELRGDGLAPHVSCAFCFS